MVSIEEIMTPDPVRLCEDNTLGDAHSLMTDKHIHHIPVVNRRGKLVGMVSHRDVLAASGSTLRKNPTDQSNRALSEIMTRDVVSISPQADTLKAAQYIHDSRHGCLPILQDGKLVGIVTEYDFVEVAISLLERRQYRDLDDYNDSEFVSDDFYAEDIDIDTSATRNWD